MKLAEPKTTVVARCSPKSRAGLVRDRRGAGDRRVLGRVDAAMGAQAAVLLRAEPTCRFEQVGACVMIVGFLVLALFG
jgi:hypothetical protein